jgi:hypothetical protein
VLLPSVPTSRSGGSFQAVFASASEEGIAREGTKSPDATDRGTTTSDAKTDGGAGSQTETQPAIAQNNGSVRATAIVSPADLLKASAKNLSRGQEVGQRQSVGALGSSGTVKEKNTHATSSESNARTASAVTIAGSMTVPAEQISRSYNIFQSMVAAAPTVAISENGQLSSDAKTQAVASISSRAASIPERFEQIADATGSIGRAGISVFETTTRAVVGDVASSPDQTNSLLVPFSASAPANVPPSSTRQQGNSVNSPSKLDNSQAPDNGVSQSSGAAKAESSSTTLTAATTRTSTPTTIAVPSALPSPREGWSYSTFQMALGSASNQAVAGNASMDAGATTHVAASGILNVPQVAQQPSRSEDRVATPVAAQASSNQNKLSTLPVTVSNAVPSQPATANRSYTIAQAELSSAPEMTAVASGSALPGSVSFVSATVPNSIASPQEQRQSTSAASNAVAHTAAIPSSADRGSPTTVHTALTQGKLSSDSVSESSSISGSTTKPELSGEPSDVRASKAAQEILQQRLDSLSVADVSTPVATPNRLTDVAVTLVGSGNQEQAISVTPGGKQKSQSDIPVQSAGITLQAPVDLSFTAGLPKNGDNTQPAGKPALKESSEATGLKNADVANIANTGTSKTAASTNGSHDASSHSAQGNGQSSQDGQSNQSQTAATASKTPDIGAAQLMHAVTHEIVAPHRVSDSTVDAARTTEGRGVPASIHADGEGTVTQGINTAKLIQTMSETEMRVGMHSAEFGNISIRTSVSQQQMVAQISVDHSDLSQAISAHVSSAQTKLGDEHGIHALIEVNNQGASSSHDSGHSSQREQRAFVSSARTESIIGAAEIDNGMNSGALMSLGNDQRLDIRA